MEGFVDFRVMSSTVSVAEYCTGFERREIVVNHNYQRSDKVWPIMAKSFLIETIILGYPMPKLVLRHVTDLQTRRAHKEIVDGQQRSEAIFDFYKGLLTLSAKLETDALKGRKYEELPEELQQRFLDYHINTDTFTGTDDLEVREMFRRMNSYTVPLNPEEQRHAVFQGNFKWFANRLGRNFGSLFIDSGMFSAKQLIRMADTKLITELVHAIYNGIETTNRTKLDALYRRFDGSFPEEQQITERVTHAFDSIFSFEALWQTSAMKPYMAYSLILAIMHINAPIPQLQGLFRNDHHFDVDPQVAVPNISALVDEFDNKDENDGARLYPEFVDAADKATNVKAKREIRFQYFCRALTGQLE